jgi:hypothetical protein
MTAQAAQEQRAPDRLRVPSGSKERGAVPLVFEATFSTAIKLPVNGGLGWRIQASV